MKQVEDFEISRREFYDQKRESNAMYWMAFTLIMKRARGENTRYLDFFSRKLAAEATYVRCLVEVCTVHALLLPLPGLFRPA